MPTQLKRFQSEGHYHFFTFSCHSRLPYLAENSSRIVVETWLERLRRRHQFYIFGYVVMPEHVHLLMSEPEIQRLAVTLNVLKTEIPAKLTGERKQFWQRRYYDFNVLSNAKHMEKLRYMHRNPVERGLVASPEDWPWSSFRNYLTDEVGRVEIESEWTWNRRERSSQAHP